MLDPYSMMPWTAASVLVTILLVVAHRLSLVFGAASAMQPQLGATPCDLDDGLEWLRKLFWLPSTLLPEAGIQLLWLVGVIGIHWLGWRPSSAVPHRLCSVWFAWNAVTQCLLLADWIMVLMTGPSNPVFISEPIRMSVSLTCKAGVNLGNRVRWDMAWDLLLQRQAGLGFLWAQIQLVPAMLGFASIVALHIALFRLLDRHWFRCRHWWRRLRREFMEERDPMVPHIASPAWDGLGRLVGYLVLVWMLRPLQYRALTVPITWDALSELSWWLLHHNHPHFSRGTNLGTGFNGFGLREELPAGWQDSWEYGEKGNASWLQSNADSEPAVLQDPFQHIVLIALESGRADMWPWDPEHDIRALLQRRSDAIRSTGGGPSDPLPADLPPDLTPTFRRLSRRGLTADPTHSMSSYTVKSLVAMLCGAYPLAVNYNLESAFPIYRDCLPNRLGQSTTRSFPPVAHNNQSHLAPFRLRLYDQDVALDDAAMDKLLDRQLGDRNASWTGPGFLSAFFQPSTANFDAQLKTMLNMGFDIVWDRDSIRQQYPDKKEETNYFGYCDHEMLPGFFRVLDRVQMTGKRLFASLITSVSHHPWKLPAGMRYRVPSEMYSSLDPTLNDYLNTIHYTDVFLGDLMQEMERRQLLDKTLFIFTGDHGVAMGNHNLYGSVNNRFESAFRVPLLFYSEHPEWQRSIIKGRHFVSQKGHWTHLDISATIYDVIFGAGWSPESQSILRPYRPRTTFSLSSPGFTSVCVRLGDWKAVFDARSLLQYQSVQAMQTAAMSSTLDESLFDLRLDPGETRSAISEWRTYHRTEAGRRRMGAPPILKWFDEAREQAFHWIRWNRVQYRFLRTA